MNFNMYSFMNMANKFACLPEIWLFSEKYKYR